MSRVSQSHPVPRYDVLNAVLSILRACDGRGTGRRTTPAVPRISGRVNFF
jgi:hypothetical protein